MNHVLRHLKTENSKNFKLLYTGKFTSFVNLYTAVI